MTVVDLKEKVAIITGAAQGQGLAEAELFVECGARVMMTDVLADDGKAAAARLGPNARFMIHDVTDAGAWAAVASATVTEWGRLDVLAGDALALEQLSEEAGGGLFVPRRVGGIDPQVADEDIEGFGEDRLPVHGVRVLGSGSCVLSAGR